MLQIKLPIKIDILSIPAKFQFFIKLLLP